MEKQALICLDFFKHGDDIWFIDFLSGGLFVSDLANGSTDLMKKLPIESWHENYRSLYVVNGKIYMPPLFATELLIYEMETKEIKKISVTQCTKKDQANFIDIFAYEKYLFFIPMAADGIIRMNTITDEIDIYNISLDYSDQTGKMNRPKFRRGCSYNGKIYLAACNGNMIIVFDMASCTYKKININDNKNDGYSLCCCTSQGMVLVSYDGSNAVILDRQMKPVHIILSGQEEKFSIALECGNSVLHIRCAGDGRAEVIDTEKNSVRIMNLDLGAEKEKFLVESFPENSFTFVAKKLDDKIWLYSTKRGSLCVLDLEGHKLQEHELIVTGTVKQKITEMRGEKLMHEMTGNKEEMVREDRIYTLNIWINAIVG